MNLHHLLRRFSRIDVVVILLVTLGLLSIVIPALRHTRENEFRRRCGANVMEIGKAILLFGSGYDDEFPVAGGQGTTWGSGLKDWIAVSRRAAFGLDADGTGGSATISSSLYYLIRYPGLSPSAFVCPSDKGATAFTLQAYQLDDKQLCDVWDFGPNPARHCSYAYQMPYGDYTLSGSNPPGTVVLADRNPWFEPSRRTAEDFSRFKPDRAPFGGTLEQACEGNSRTHRGRGQNVLFLDTHVEFAMRASCGYEGDNIYTSWDGNDKVRGLPPKPYDAQPAHRLDSLLVNDPPLNRSGGVDGSDRGVLESTYTGPWLWSCGPRRVDLRDMGECS